MSAGHVEFDPAAMRSAAGTIDAARARVDADVKRVVSFALPSMVVAGVKKVGELAGKAGHAIASLNPF